MPAKPPVRTQQAKKIKIVGAREHNLKNVSLDLAQAKARSPLTRFMRRANAAMWKACPPMPGNSSK